MFKINFVQSGNPSSCIIFVTLWRGPDFFVFACWSAVKTVWCCLCGKRRRLNHAAVPSAEGGETSDLPPTTVGFPLPSTLQQPGLCWASGCSEHALPLSSVVSMDRCCSNLGLPLQHVFLCCATWGRSPGPSAALLSPDMQPSQGIVNHAKWLLTLSLERLGSILCMSILFIFKIFSLRL